MSSVKLGYAIIVLSSSESVDNCKQNYLDKLTFRLFIYFFFFAERDTRTGHLLLSMFAKFSISFLDLQLHRLILRAFIPRENVKRGC